jgi:hypothetical protein
LLVHNPQSPEDHRLDGMAHRDNPGLWVWLSGLINDGANAECIAHHGYQAEMIQDLTTIGRLHSRLLQRGDSTNTPKLLKETRTGAESRIQH